MFTATVMAWDKSAQTFTQLEQSTEGDQEIKQREEYTAEVSGSRRGCKYRRLLFSNSLVLRFTSVSLNEKRSEEDKWRTP